MNIVVNPAVLRQAAEAVAAANERAAHIDPASLPHAAGASPADVKAAAIALRIASGLTALSTAIAGEGPAIVATTAAGTATLTASDGENAAVIGSVAPGGG